MHSSEPKSKRIALVESAKSHKRRGNRNFSLMRKNGHILCRSRGNNTTPCVNDRTLRLVDHLGKLIKLRCCGRRLRMVCAERNALWVLLRSKSLLAVLRNIDDDGSRLSVRSDIERLRNSLRDFVGRMNEEIVLAHCARNASRICLLECVSSNKRKRHLACNENKRNAVDIGRCETGNRIGGSRA